MPSLVEIIANCITFPVMKISFSSFFFICRLKIIVVLNTGTIMGCKSGKLFLPFIYLDRFADSVDTVFLLLLAGLCVDVQWFMSAVHFCNCLLQTHMSKHACIGMSPFTAHNVITDAKASLRCITHAF